MTLPPGSDFGLERVDAGQCPMDVPVHRQTLLALPPTHRAHAAIQVASNLLPGIESIGHCCKHLRANLRNWTAGSGHHGPKWDIEGTGRPCHLGSCLAMR